MSFPVGQAIPIRYYHGISGATVLARVVDEADGTFGAELTLTENAALLAAGYPGFYESTWTPDAEGHWKILIKVGGAVYGQLFYYVGGGALEGRAQILEVSITDAANAGVTTVATVGTGPCLIESVVIHADAAQTGDMTSCAVEGGVGQVVEFIGAADAIQANLDAADKQVGWTGAVRLAVGKTITIDLQGTGATAVDLTIVIKYRACADGGVLS